MEDGGYIDPSVAALFDKRIQTWIVKYEKIFEECPQGKSFSLPLTVGKLPTVRSAISRRFNKNGKMFRIVKHDTCYEVYRKE